MLPVLGNRLDFINHSTLETIKLLKELQHPQNNVLTFKASYSQIDTVLKVITLAFVVVNC